MVELHQPMTEAMGDIHHSIVHCMSVTLGELKRSNTIVSPPSYSYPHFVLPSFYAFFLLL